MKVFVEFVESVFFVDLKLSQNPLMPTTDAQFSVRENLEICHFILKKFLKWQISRFIPLCFPAKSFPLARIDSSKIIFKKLFLERKMNPEPISQSPSENESSSTVSSWSEDETPRSLTMNLLFPIPKWRKPNKRNRKKTTLNFFMNLLSISGRKTNFSNRNSQNKTIFSGKFTMN